MALFKRLHLFTFGLLMMTSFSNAFDVVGNANSYIDEVLQNLRNEKSIVDKLDPIKVPDINEGNFQASDLEIRGLSSLYRSGDCTIDYNFRTVKIGGELGVKGMHINLKYRAKVLFFWITGKVEMTVTGLAVKMALTASDGRAKIEAFKVTDLGEYKIQKITGMSVVLNWLLKLIANSVAKKSRAKIIDAMEGGVAKAVGDILAKIDIPIKSLIKLPSLI